MLTFRGEKLHPRDRELRARLDAVSPVISRNLSMWSAWIGFNASHSLGALLFGLVCGYLALVRPDVVFGSACLQILGLTTLLGYALLAVRYWFEVSRRWILLATALYLLALWIDHPPNFRGAPLGLRPEAPVARPRRPPAARPPQGSRLEPTICLTGALSAADPRAPGSGCAMSDNSR